MKFCRFEVEAAAHIGLVESEYILDLSEIIHDDTRQLILQIDKLKRQITELAHLSRHRHSLKSARLLCPLTVPGKILCSGINYHCHFTENPKAVQTSSPFFFTKLPNTVIGPGSPIIKPALTEQLDYEVEFSVVIGSLMNCTPPEEVMDHVFGYTILNDVSARDVQFIDNQITLGKNFDSFAPIGPYIVTADEIPNPANVRLQTRVNGMLLQDGNTNDWVYALPFLLSSLSQVMTLQPGDIVTTGTPAGVGYFQRPQVFLSDGDEVALEVEGIGTLINPVVGTKKRNTDV